MPLEDILLALRAVDEGALHRDELSRLLAILDTWDRGGLTASCGQLLTQQFRVDPSSVRRWEREITGQNQRRIGRYQLRRKVGQGGMGLVFEAVDPSLGRTVALKLLAGDRLESPTSVQRFLREAKSAGAFNHPNIVHAFDAGIDGDLPYLVMEFVDGENLYQILKRRGTIDVDDGITWLDQAARALEVLERQRWVHGDVKPSNFILTREGVVKLADLGLCGPPGKPRPGTSPHGTPPYIAPEVLEGDFIDHRADLYSLGATAYHLLAGRPHILSRSIEDLSAAIREPVPPLAELRPDLPGELVAIIERLLEIRPEDRFAGGSELLTALDPLLPHRADPAATTADLVELAEAAEAAAISGQRAPRRGAWLALILAVVLVGIAVGVTLGPERGRTGGGSGAGDEGPTEIGSGSTDAAAVERWARWNDVRNSRAGNYRALFAWLAEDGADMPELEEWRAALTAELAAVAEPVWQEVHSRAEAARSAGRFHAALLALSEFPEDSRAGPYQVSWQEALETTRRSRERRLAGILLAIDGAPGPLDAWRAWRALDGETAEDRAWYRPRIERELSGLPFLASIDGTIAEAERLRAARSEMVRTTLRRGGIPEPDLGDPERLPEELALLWLSRHPQVAGSDRPLLERLYAADLLAEVPPKVLGVLLALCGDAANPEAETEAARLAREAEAARRGDDLAIAEARWVQLAKPPLDETTAGRAVLPGVDAHRAELERRVFLRSSNFVATVEGGWGKAPAFRWEGDDPRLLEEWRADRSRWSIESGGRRARGRDGLQGLELAIPFEPSFSLVLEVELPARDWSVIIGRGESVLGFAGPESGRECRVTAGSRAGVAERLSAGRGAPWRITRDPADPRRVRFALEYREGVWRIGDGGLERIFPTSDPAPPAWIWVALPTGASLRGVEVTGAPVEAWLEARRQFLGQRP